VSAQNLGLLGDNDLDFGGVPRANVFHFPSDIISKLNDDAATASYWDSIPSCDTLTAAQKQNAIDAVTQQTQFQTFFRR
jgi:hypothetical protein